MTRPGALRIPQSQNGEYGHDQHTAQISSIIYYRLDLTPQSGQSSGLTLVLDARTHLVSASSVIDNTQASLQFSEKNKSMK